MKRIWPVLAVWLWVAMTTPGGAAPIPLGGQVVDAEGKPLRGASVALVPVLSRFAAAELQLQGKAPEAAARAASGADGRFEVSAPAPGMWEVQVTAPGFVPRRFSLLPLLEPLELPKLEMGPEAPLRVRVVDPQGRPVAGARVAVSFGESPMSGALWWIAPQLVTTGPDGSATASRWKAWSVTLEAAAPGHPLASKEVTGKESTAELRLAPGCPRTLQVTTRGKDGEARPVARALAGRASWTLGAAGEDGRVTVTAPCDKDLRITVETRDGRQAKATLRRAPAAPPADQATDPPVPVTLPAEPQRVSGQVLTQGSRAPVAGALVWVGGDPGAFVRADAKGAYTLPLLGDEPNAASAEAVGHLPDSAPARPGTAGPVFLLPPLATAGGTVVDEAGRPVAGAHVQGRSADSLWNPFLSTRSDARGEFRLRVVSGEELTLSASHPDFAAAVLSVPSLAPHASRSGLRLVLTRGLSAFGRVVDAAGQPVAGAEVWLLPAMDEEKSFSILRNLEQRPSPAVTDARGVFTLEHLKEGRMDLRANARGFAPTRVRGLQLAMPETAEAVDGKPAAAVDLGTVTLAPGVTLSGVVVDPRDRPVAGATVQLLDSASPDPWAASSDEEDTVETAADGSFSFSGVPPDEPAGVSVFKQGYAPASFPDVQVPTPEPLRIVLTPGSRVAGQVVDEAGDPVAGATVGLFRVGSQSLAGAMSDLAGMAHSGEDGAFAVDGISAGKIRLAAGATGFLRTEGPVVELTAGRDVEGLEVVMRRGAVVTGRILGPDGEPLPDAWVEGVGGEDTDGLLVPFGGATADADGRYRLEGVPEGAARSFAAQAEGFQRSVKDLEVRPGENRLDFRLEAGHEIAGRVVDAGGAPVAGAAVSVAPPDEMYIGDQEGWAGWGKGARTSADGSFLLTGIPTGVYEVYAEKEGYAPGRLDSVEIAGPVRGLELRLTAAGSIRGRLTGVEVADLAAAEVNAHPLSDGTAPGYATGQVDFQGQYRIGGLGAGEWRVLVETASGLRASGTVTVPPGGEAVLDLELGGGFTLTGRVLSRGAPISAAWVIVAAADGGEGYGFATTGPQGEFRIPGLAAGSYSLRIANSSGLNHEETVEVTADRDIQVEIAGQRVSGRVVDATDQSPIPYAEVSLVAVKDDAGDWPQPATRSDDQGLFALQDIASGTYRLQAQMDGYAPASTPVEVGTVGVDGVVLALQPTEGLVLEVRGALGNPPPQILVAFLDATGRAVLTGTHSTGENGRVRISSAPPGTWQLLVSASGHATVEQSVQVPAPPVSVALPRSSTLTVAAPGAPDRSVVTLNGAAGRPFRSLAGQVEQEWHVQDGQAEIAGLPPGRWQVRVATPDGQVLEATATTAAGSPARVLVR